jgi:hypothetical protein
MKDLNKTRFEEEWGKAFEEAELPPNNDVWARLDAHLANQETRKYKIRLMWFQRIAAGVLLLLLGGGAWLWIGGQTTGPQLTQETGQTSSAGSEMVRTEGGNATFPAEATTPSGQPAGELAQRPEKGTGTNDSPERAKQIPQPGTSPDALAKAGPATERRPAGDAAENAVDLSSSPALAGERSGVPASGTRRAKSSRRSTTDNPAAYLAHGGRNSKSGLNNSRATTHYKSTPRTPAATVTGDAVTSEERIAKTAPVPGTADERLLIAGITPRTLRAQEPVIRPWSILPHLSDAYWAQVADKDEKVASKEDARWNRWQAGLAFAPGTYQPNFRVNESSSAYVNTMNQLSAANFGRSQVDASTLSAANRELETATAQGLSYQTGLRLEYALSRRLSVQSGVDYLYNSSSVDTYSYLRNATNSRNEPAFASILNYENQARAESLTMADTPASVEYDSQFSTATPPKSLSQLASVIPVQNVYKYVGIPVRVNYKLLDRKLGATLGAGVSGDVFLSNRFGNEERGISEVHITSTKGTAYRKLGISAWLGLKMQYRFTRKYSAFLEPSYRAAITSFTNTQTLQSRPSLFGVGTGLQMLF